MGRELIVHRYMTVTKQPSDWWSWRRDARMAVLVGQDVCDSLFGILRRGVLGRVCGRNCEDNRRVDRGCLLRAVDFQDMLKKSSSCVVLRSPTVTESPPGPLRRYLRCAIVSDSAVLHGNIVGIDRAELLVLR